MRSAGVVLALAVSVGSVCECYVQEGLPQIRALAVLSDPRVAAVAIGKVALETEDQDESGRKPWRLHNAAQWQRIRGKYAEAGHLYEAVLSAVESHWVEVEGGASLLTWSHYQFADLLLHHHRSMQASNTSDAMLVPVAKLKRKAVHHFEHALAASTALTDARQQLGAREQVHCWNSMGQLAMDLHDVDNAILYFRRAIALNVSAVPPIGNLVLAHLALGQVSQALAYSVQALALQPRDFRLLHNHATIYYELDQRERAQYYWEQALVVQPQSIETLVSLAMVHGHRGDAAGALALLDRAERSKHAERSVCATTIAVKMHKAVAHLKMVYDSVEELLDARHQYESALSELEALSAICGPVDPFTTIGAGSMGYYAIYQGFDDLIIRARLASIYRNIASELSFTAPHVERGRALTYTFDVTTTTFMSSNESKMDALHGTVRQQRRIRIGFVSSFFRHHSVGLLLARVLAGINRDKFEITVLTYPTRSQDKVAEAIISAADLHIELHPRKLEENQRRVAALQLDVLVFSEIGMDVATYLLAFARLALRTAVFWGHAITSGIDTIDYFITSTLFREEVTHSVAQRRYSECLYEMQGLSTAFPRPPPLPSELQHRVSRENLGLPPASVLPTMLLVPQTLYKLHPDFDELMERILSAVPGSFIVLPVGDRPLLVQQLTRRWRRTLSSDVYRRVFFVRALRSTEFLQLCAMSDLVLDTFPVGGGRSSFEVFATGTPILGLRSRTSILQLTVGMYRAMGMDASCCMFDDADTLVREVERLLVDKVTALAELRATIAENKHKLYDAGESAVKTVREWEQFFEAMLASPPPSHAPSSAFADGYLRDSVSCPLSTVRDDMTNRRLLFEIAVTHGPTRALRLYDGEDPYQTAAAFAMQFEPPLDMLQEQFLGKVLWNAQQRAVKPIVTTFSIEYATLQLKDGSMRSFPFEVRFGDDLHQAMRWQVSEQLSLRGLSVSPTEKLSLVGQAIDRAITKLGAQYESDRWISARAIAQPLLGRHPSTEPRWTRDCIALVVTTCRRMTLFARTMDSLRRELRITYDRE